MELPDLLTNNLQRRPPASDSENEELGKILVSAFISVVISEKGVPIELITETFIAKVFEWIKTIEAKEVKSIVYEKALHKAADGDFKEAGRIFREYVWDDAQNEFNEEMAIHGMTLRINRIKGGLEKARRIQERDVEIYQEYTNEIAKGKKPAVVKKMLGKKYDLGRSQIDRIINKFSAK